MGRAPTQFVQVGDRYHRWKVLAKTATGWLCRCECGTERDLHISCVKVVKSCGCANPFKRVNDVTQRIQPGQRFGRWTTVKQLPRDAKRHTKWLCQCDCGSEGAVDGYVLVNGASKSCGCRRWEMGRRRGISPPSSSLPKGSRDKHGDMNCNNCGEVFRPMIEGIVISADGKPAAGICPDCCKDVRVAKLIMRRPDIGSFAYEQWAPVEMMSGGLTSPKRAG